MCVGEDRSGKLATDAKGGEQARILCGDMNENNTFSVRLKKSVTVAFPFSSIEPPEDYLNLIGRQYANCKTEGIKSFS